MLMAKSLKSPVMIAFVASLALAGCATKKKIPDNANQLGLNNGMNSAGGVGENSPEYFTSTVGDRVFFTTDSSSLTAEGRATLDRQAQWLNSYTSYPITIEGHADERGTRQYNLALGARRAAATRDYLVAKGVQRSRIRTISYGKERPVAVCNDISCWSQNRRARTVLAAPSG